MVVLETLISDSSTWILCFGFLGLDSLFWIPGLYFLVWIPGFGFLGLDSQAGGMSASVGSGLDEVEVPHRSQTSQ